MTVFNDVSPSTHLVGKLLTFSNIVKSIFSIDVLEANTVPIGLPPVR